MKHRNSRRKQQANSGKNAATSSSIDEAVLPLSPPSQLAVWEATVNDNNKNGLQHVCGNMAPRLLAKEFCGPFEHSR